MVPLLMLQLDKYLFKISSVHQLIASLTSIVYSMVLKASMVVKVI